MGRLIVSMLDNPDSDVIVDAVAVFLNENLVSFYYRVDDKLIKVYSSDFIDTEFYMDVIKSNFGNIQYQTL